MATFPPNLFDMFFTKAYFSNPQYFSFLKELTLKKSPLGRLWMAGNGLVKKLPKKAVVDMDLVELRFEMLQRRNNVDSITILNPEDPKKFALRSLNGNNGF